MPVTSLQVRSPYSEAMFFWLNLWYHNKISRSVFSKTIGSKKNGARRREFRSTETNLNLSHPIRRTTTQKKSRLHGSFCVSAAVSCHLSLSLSFFRSVASQWPHRFFWDRGCKIRDILEIPAFFHDHPAQISMSNNSSQYRMNESDVR